MTTQRQRPVKGGREAIAGTVLKTIRRAVEAEARRFNVSKSFVVAVAVAQALGINIESYETHDQRRAKLRRVK